MSNRQVTPRTERWTQKKMKPGKPLLQFAEPKRGKPPLHLADIEPATSSRVKSSALIF